MRKKLGRIGVLLGVSTAVGVVALTAEQADAGRGNGPVIFVTSQGLYFDSIVTADPVPPRGPFQPLRMGPNGLETDYGPRDTGYVGGRWWMDSNGNGEMDPDDHYFVCPLLPPGREAP
ncbi:MAG: hypothetical protein ACYTFA_03345 [Planctomycetota bacterium]